MKKYFIIIITLNFLFIGCKEETPIQSTKEFTEKWGNLNSNIEGIEKSILKTHKSSKEKIERLREVRDSLEEKANHVKTEMKNDYISLAEEIARLEIDFRDIKDVSDNYFEIAEDIVIDLEKRNNDYASTARERFHNKKATFYDLYGQVGQTINELRSIYLNIDQIDLIVDFNIMMNQIDKAIEELNRINVTSNQIVQKLKNLKQQGENVIKTP